MDQVVTLLLKQVTRDELGGEIIAWVSQGDVWGEVTPLRGHEYFAAQEVNPEDITRFRLRYDDVPGLTKAWRLEWRGEQYDIEHNLDIDSQNRTWEIMAHTAQS